MPNFSPLVEWYNVCLTSRKTWFDSKKGYQDFGGCSRLRSVKPLHVKRSVGGCASSSILPSPTKISGVDQGDKCGLEPCERLVQFQCPRPTREIGMWLSLGEHSVWVRGVVGSNPTIPTKKTLWWLWCNGSTRGCGPLTSGFDSHQSPQLYNYGLLVKPGITPPCQGGITGSNPVQTAIVLADVA